jgi:uncharacterized protein (DUF983 family)
MIGMVEALLIIGMIVAYLLLKVMVEAKPPRIYESRVALPLMIVAALPLTPIMG